jgi:short-subunit dehydrogenase
MARVFARHGHALVLVARRVQRLEALAAEIAAAGAPRPLVLALDLAAPRAAARLSEALRSNGMEPQFIVNNAGFGLVGRATALSRDEQLAMIDLNVRALTELSLAFTDSLARHQGGILNVGSVAGFLPGPGSAVYYAGKAYVVSLTEALHQELGPRGIRVSCLCPGPVETEFQARAGVPEAKVPWPLVVPASRVAEAGYRGLMRGRRIVIPGLGVWLFVRLLLPIVPRPLLLKLVEARQVRRQS